MIVSGLWKLAAMAGVIGVGLVAAFQAQKSLQKPTATSANAVVDEAQEQTASADDLASSETATLAEGVESNPAPDPFAERTAMADDLSPREIPNGDEAPAADQMSATGSVSETRSAAVFPAEDEPNSNDGPSLNAKTPSSLGLDFRDQVPESTVNLVASPNARRVQPAAFEEEPPARSPNDAPSSAEVDPFAVRENPEREAVAPPEPFIRGTNAVGIRKTNSENMESAADPFSDKRPKVSFTEETPKVNRPKAGGSTAPAELGSPISIVTNADPFATTPVEAAPATASPPPLPFPAADEPRTLPSQGQPQPLAGNSLSADDPLDDPADAPRTRNPNASSRSAFPSANPALPRLPTEVSDPDLVNDDPAPRRTAPPSLQQPLDDRPSARSNDFSGDGTVGTDAPRGLQQPRLTIEKIAPQQAVLGEPLVYSVIVKNVGGSDARQVVVEDRIPKGTELTGTAPRAEMIDKKLIWRIGTMKPNEERKISIRVIPRQEGSIGSVARVNFATEVAAEIVVAAPQLSFTVNAPRQVRIGESFDLTFLLKNTGNAAATNVSVRDIVPDGLKHEAAADIECPIGKLAPGESREIVLQVTAVKPGKVKNHAILSGDGGIAQELESPIEIIGEQLVLTRTGHNRVFVDRPTVFTNSVKNDGNAEVKQVRVSEIVPVGMEFVEASSGGRFDPVERSIYWTVGPLPPGTQTAVSAKLIAKSPGMQHGKITAAGSAGSAAALKSEIEVVGRPELQIETVGRTGQVAVGDQLTSKIQLANHGSESARNVALSIRLPRQLKLVEVSGAKYTIRDGVIAFEPVVAIGPKEVAGFVLVMEAIEEADAQVSLEIAADHLSKPARRNETVQIAAEVR